MKYYLVKFKEVRGEYENSEFVLNTHDTKPTEDELLMWMYGLDADEVEDCDEVWWGDESIVAVSYIQEVPEDHYNVLKEYL